MHCIPIHTRALTPPRDDLYAVFDESVIDVCEGDIVFVTSKVVSIHQGRCVRIENAREKHTLIVQESDAVLEDSCQKGMLVGIKHAMVNPFGGIDESNANGYTVLLPENPHAFAQDIRTYLQHRHAVTDIGVIIVDSHFIPLRAGSLGISVGFSGIRPLRSYAGKTDIFGRELSLSQINIVDSLAALSSIVLGEGDEQTPVGILRGMSFVEFTKDDEHEKLTTLPFGDSFCAFLRLFKKKQ